MPSSWNHVAAGTVIALLVLARVVFAGSAAEPAGTQADPITAFVEARIIDGTGRAPLETGTLLVGQGRILAVGPSDAVTIPPGAERVDLEGKTVMPGIINAHGHTSQNPEATLRLFANYGVTTVISLGGEGDAHVALHEAQDSGGLDRARLYFAGPNVSGSPGQALDQVEDLARMGADWVKIRLDSGRGASDPGYGEVVDRAHELGLRVAAHIYTLEDARTVLGFGADLIAHSVRDRGVDTEFVQSMTARGACLSPTLTREVSTFIYQGTPDFFSDPFFLRYADPGVVDRVGRGGAVGGLGGEGRDALEMAQRNLKTLHDAGIGIALGTDSGASSTRFPGYFEHLEMDLMVEAGLTPMETIVAATGGAARCAGLDSVLGTLEAGKWADFLVLDEDPIEAIGNTKSLESVWIAGNRVAGE